MRKTHKHTGSRWHRVAPRTCPVPYRRQHPSLASPPRQTLAHSQIKMARKKIREYMAKLLVLRHLNKYAAPGVLLDQGMTTLGSLMVTTETNFRHFKQETPEFATSALVVKPDMLFGKRGKHNLVLVNKDLDTCEKWIYDRMDQEVQVGHVKGKLTHFLIEKFVPHKDEYYLAMTTTREGTVIRFSVAGGIEVEENWDKVKTLSVALDADIEQVDLVRLLLIYVFTQNLLLDNPCLKAQNAPLLTQLNRWATFSGRWALFLTFRRFPLRSNHAI